MIEINCGRKCNACSPACNACSFVVFAGVFVAQRTSKRHPVPNDSLCVGAGSAGFESASFGSLIALAFCPPTPLIPMPQPSTFLFALLSSQYLQPRLPEYWYYQGVTGISGEVNGFERGGRFICSGRCMDPGLGNLTSWLTLCCNGKTESCLNNPKGQEVLFHHSA